MKSRVMPISAPALAIAAAVDVLLALFVYGVLHAGPLAPVAVTVVKHRIYPQYAAK